MWPFGFEQCASVDGVWSVECGVWSVECGVWSVMKWSVMKWVRGPGRVQIWMW